MFEHPGQDGQFTFPLGRDGEGALINPVMDEASPGMFCHRPHLDLGFHRVEFIRIEFLLDLNRDVFGREDAVLELNNVMDRAVAKLAGFEALAHIHRVLGIDNEMFLDELAHRVDLGQSLGDDAPAGQVGHAQEWVVIAANFLFANGLFSEAWDGLGPGLDDGLGSQLPSTSWHK